MNLSELFIRRPVTTTLVMAGILIFGIMGYRLLPVSDLPNVDFPTIQVGAALPGASPETMASSVATPLERQFSTIAGLDNMTSTSTLGSTSITLQFNLSRNLDGAALDVQSAISAAARQPVVRCWPGRAAPGTGPRCGGARTLAPPGRSPAAASATAMTGPRSRGSGT